MVQQTLTQQQAFVTVLYDGLFGRTPSSSEVQSWTNLINAGTSEPAVAQAFLSSAEYQDQDLSNARFVTSLYQGFLNRTPAAAEIAGWKTALANGTSQAQVVTAFDQSAEARQHFTSQVSGQDRDAAFVTVLYQGLLERAPTPAEVKNWTDILHLWVVFLGYKKLPLDEASDEGKREIAQDFLRSAEYQNLSNTHFVQSLYQGFLGRTAGATEASGWTTALSNGTSRAQIVSGFDQAPEAKRHWGISVVPTS